MSLPMIRTALLISAIILLESSALSPGPDAFVELPKGASCPQSIFRPSLLFYLAPFVMAILICNKNITSDIRLMYGN